MPWCVLGAMIVYRKSWFEEIGVNEFPETWEQYREAGKKLKANGHPLGQTWGTLSVTRPPSPIPISGPGAARRSRLTARPLSSIPRRRSTPRNS